MKGKKLVQLRRARQYIPERQQSIKKCFIDLAKLSLWQRQRGSLGQLINISFNTNHASQLWIGFHSDSQFTFFFFTFSSHTEYVKRESIVIARLKKNYPVDECSCFLCFRTQSKQKIFLSVCLSVCMYVLLSVCVSVCMYVLLSVCLSVCMYVLLSVCLSVYM